MIFKICCAAMTAAVSDGSSPFIPAQDAHGGNVMIFKFIFAALTAATMFYFLIIRRHSSLPRVFLLAFFGTGILFILWPGFTNQLAVLVGIGRGADLVLYLSVLVLFFLCFSIYIRFRETEEILSKVVRELAISRPIQENHFRNDDPGSEGRS